MHPRKRAYRPAQICTVLAKLIPFIIAEQALSADLLLDALHEIEAGILRNERRRAANSIMEGAGDYLPNYYLSKFIRAEISDAEAIRLISERKVYLERAITLFPTILRLLGASQTDSIRSALLQINDVCFDFPGVAESNHYKKQKKEALLNVTRLRNALMESIHALESTERHVSIEFNHHKRSLKHAYVPLEDSDQILREMQHLQFAADVVLYKEQCGLEPLILGHNKARTHIVECAYSLSLQFERPKLVTTPGSDFAFLCALIFELATGVADESLAGAINRFAKS
jgi:hypothetical protein